jgi:hypothetical protein
MRLFDQVKRTALEPKGYLEESYSFLNRSAWPSLTLVRLILEEWFSRFPQSARADLAGRFISGSDSQHLSAFFELWSHELLRCSGCTTLEAHPEVAGMDDRPDFLVRTRGGDEIYVEVFCSHDRFPVPDSRNLKSVLEALTRLESPDFFINILSQHGVPATPPPIRQLRAMLRRWLSQLDYERTRAVMQAGSWQSLPTCKWSWDGWEVEFTATSKDKLRGVEGVRTLGIPGVYGGFPDSAAVLRDKIGEKARRYRMLKHSLLMVIDAIDMFLDVDDVILALFGSREDAAPDRDSLQSRAAAREAVWLGRGRARNQHVSSALVAKEVLPWHPNGDFAVVVQNPYAERPMAENVLMLNTVSADHGYLKALAGSSPSEILGLAPQWPRFGQPM